jgi:hypothetical protein
MVFIFEGTAPPNLIGPCHLLFMYSMSSYYITIPFLIFCTYSCEAIPYKDWPYEINTILGTTKISVNFLQVLLNDVTIFRRGLIKFPSNDDIFR